MRRRRRGVVRSPRRGRWLAAGTSGALVLALLSGCAPPAGVDGQLADDWPAMSEPTSFTPPADTCYGADYTVSASLGEFDSVDCSALHRTETIYVGTFTGKAAAGTAAPPAASAELRAAYAQCDKQARDFLGKDFRHGRLWLGVVVPSANGWRGGSRWFRCDLLEKADHENLGDTVNRRGSLRGALTTASALSLTCYQVKAQKDGRIDSRTPSDCAKAHNSEFVGVFGTAVTTYPATAVDWNRLHTACRKVIARYVGVPDDANLKYRTGTVVVPGSAVDWQSGNRGVRCYLYASDKTFTKSLKGAGTKGLPVKQA